MKEQLRLLTAQLAEQEEDEAGAEDGGGVGPAAADGDGSSSPAYSDDADFDDGSDDLELPDDSGARMPAAEPAAAEDGTAGDGTAEQLAQAVALAEEHGRRLAAAVAEQQRLGDEHARCTALLEGEQRAKAELSAALETQQKHADEMEVALGDLQRQVAGEKAAVDESGEGLAEQAALAEVLSEKLATAVADHAQVTLDGSSLQDCLHMSLVPTVVSQLSAVAKQLERNLAEETRRATAAETSVGTERRRADLLEDQLRVESASMRMTEGQQSRQLAATEKRAEDALERVRALQDEKRALEAKVTAAEAAAERQPVPMRAAASSRSGSPSEASFYSAEQEPEGVDEDIVEEVESEGHVAQGAEGPAYMAHEAHVRAADAAGQQAAAVPRPQPAASEQDVATLRGELRVLRGELTDTGAELEAQQAKSERQLRLQLEEAGRAQEVAANAAAQSLREERAAGAELTVALDKAYRQVAELEAAAKAASAEPEGSAEARLASVQHEAAAAAAQAAEAQQRLTSELESTRAAHDEALERAVANEKRIAENAQHIAALEAAATTAAAAARQAPPESAAPVGSVDALAQLQVKLDAANAELAERQRRLVASEASEAQAAAALRHREEQLAERERTMPRQQIAAPDLGVAAAGEQAASAEQTQALVRALTLPRRCCALKWLTLCRPATGGSRERAGVAACCIGCNVRRAADREHRQGGGDWCDGYDAPLSSSVSLPSSANLMLAACCAGRKLRELRAKVRAAPASPPRPSEADQAAQEEERRREAAQQAEVVEALQLASAELLEAQKELQVLRVAQQEHEDKEKAWEREKKSRRQRGEGGGDAAEVERLKGCVDELVAQLGAQQTPVKEERVGATAPSDLWALRGPLQVCLRRRRGRPGQPVRRPAAHDGSCAVLTVCLVGTDRETIEELEARLETLAAARNAAQAAASPGRHAEYDLRNSCAALPSRAKAVGNGWVPCRWAGGESRQTPGVRFEPPSAMVRAHSPRPPCTSARLTLPVRRTPQPSEWRAAPSPCVA